MAQIVVYMTEDEKMLIENIAEFTFLDSASKFCKMNALKKAEEISNTPEFKLFLKNIKIINKILKGEEDELL